MATNKYYRYIIDHDTGYAPNPFFGYMTLACCKPCLENTRGIRKWITNEMLKAGDVWILGVGGKNLLLEDYGYEGREFKKIPDDTENRSRLVFAFRVAEICNFEEYFREHTYEKKKFVKDDPIQRHGDNHLHNPTSIEGSNLHRYQDEKESEPIDIPCDIVVISRENDFYYFGSFAPQIPPEFQEALPRSQATSCKFSLGLENLNTWLKGKYSKPGFFGFPSFNKGEDFRDDSEDSEYLQAIFKNWLDPDVKKKLLDPLSSLKLRPALNEVIQ